MKPLWLGLLMVGLACPEWAAANGAAPHGYAGRGNAGVTVHSGGAGYGRGSGGFPHAWHGDGRRYHRFVYLQAGGYAPVIYAQPPDYDSAEAYDDQSPGDQETVYYDQPEVPQAQPPYPVPSPRVASKPVAAAAPVIPHAVHGQVWKYSHDGQTTYTNIQPPASSGAKLMFSYAESCTRECTYVTDH